jgi:hypothetical protein
MKTSIIDTSEKEPRNVTSKGSEPCPCYIYNYIQLHTWVNVAFSILDLGNIALAYRTFAPPVGWKAE